jgi:hypothetical protein
MAHTAIRLGYLSASTGGGGANFEEYADLASFPPVGEEATIYLALDTEKIYRWDGASYVQISPSEVTSVNTEVGDVVLDKADIGLDQVDNTSDLDKPISDDTQDALDALDDRIVPIEDRAEVLTVYAYENNAQVYADGQPGVRDTSALIRDGWYFKNSVAGQKINWYYFDGTSQGNVTLGDLKSSYAVMTFDAVSGASSPIIAIYTFPTGTGDVIPGFAHSRIVYDGPMTPTPVAGKQYLVYAGENPPVHPQLPRINLALIPGLSIGDKLPTEQILTISLGSSSGAAVNQIQYIVETLGLFSDPVKHEMDLRIRTVPLNSSSKIDSTYLPSYVDDVLEFANLAAFPPTGDAGILYLALDTNKIYRWSGSVYIEVSQGITDHTLLSNIGTNSHADIDTALNLITNVNWTGDYNNGVTYTVGDGVMYNGASFRMIASIGAAGYAPPAYPGNWLQVTDYVSPNDIGLGNVDNTSDLDKPISNDTQDALDLKVDLAGDTMTGQLTMQDSTIVIDYTATSGFATTTELGNNYVLLLSNNGTDSKELNQTASTSTLNRTNTASTTSDANMILSVEEGAPYLFAQTTDYANDTFSQTTMTSQNIAIDFADNASGVNSTVIFGTGAYAIQTTQSDGSYVFIEGTSTGTSATQYDGVDSTPLMPTLPEHYTVKEYVDNLVSGGETGILERFEVMKEPTGFVNRTSSTTSFVDLTREFTIAPVGASYEVYVQANKYVKTTAETITLDNISGNHYIYFDIDGNLSSTQVINSDLFQNNALISIIYWNSDTSTHTYFAEERHGLSMDGATHSYLHTVFGARYLSGLALQNFVVNGDGSLATHAQFTSDSGSIRDEDLLITMSAQTQIPVLYRQGQLWRKKAADSFPVIYSGTAGYTGTRLPFNEFTGGAWQLTEVANNDFVLVHIFATNDKETPIVAIQGTATYLNVTAARLAASTEITSLTGLPFAEFVALGSVVFQSSNSYTNTPKARTRSINGGDYVDFRGTQLYTPAGEPTTHSLLSNLSSDDHLQYHTDARGDARYNLKSAGDISEGTFSIINNEPLPTNITGLSFDTGIVRSFEAQVSIKIDATSDLFEEVIISGIQKGSSWGISIKSVGDVSGVQFSITNAGQMQYTSENYTGFVSGTLKFRALTTSI